MFPSVRQIQPTRSQSIQRIHSEREPLEINSNFLDGFRGRQFIDCRHGENRFALVHRLIREPSLAPLCSPL